MSFPLVGSLHFRFKSTFWDHFSPVHLGPARKAQAFLSSSTYKLIFSCVILRFLFVPTVFILHPEVNLVFETFSNLIFGFSFSIFSSSLSSFPFRPTLPLIALFASGSRACGRFQRRHRRTPAAHRTAPKCAAPASCSCSPASGLVYDALLQFELPPDLPVSTHTLCSNDEHLLINL